MTTPPTDSDSPDTISRSPHREAIQSEAGLRRVLAYICAQRHRRLIAFAAVFLLIYSVTRIPISIVSSAVFGLLIAFVNSKDITVPPELWDLLLSLMTIIPSLIVTLLIFMRLRKIYTKYIPTGQPMGASDFGELDG